MVRIAITAGEPAGIGPDLVLQTLFSHSTQAEIKALFHTLTQRQIEIVVIADPELLIQRAAQLQLSIEQAELPIFCLQQYQTISVYPVLCSKTVTTGQLDSDNAHYVLETLTLAAEGCIKGTFSAMVTAPLHKGIINDAGIRFSGHTEFLADITNTPLPVMMLATDTLRVALVTTHLPLADVSKAITEERLSNIIRILNHDLTSKYKFETPRILVCGLNPHAGENGHLGKEEINIIEPTLNKLRNEGITLIGPLPADTLFTPKHLSQADAVLAMYHDQGLPVLKYSGFGKAINITLGLPIIRTSVDHGTALDLAGTGNIDNGSFIEAIKAAISLV